MAATGGGKRGNYPLRQRQASIQFSSMGKHFTDFTCPSYWLATSWLILGHKRATGGVAGDSYGNDDNSNDSSSQLFVSRINSSEPSYRTGTY
jgi:hypothetical protein